MKRYVFRGRMVTINELSELSGVLPHTLRDRFRRGYTVEQAIRPTPVHQSVDDFCEASHWRDWVGTSIEDVYQIYWNWCLKNDYSPTSKQGFSRHLNTIYPHLKTVPTTNDSGSKRIIRVR